MNEARGIEHGFVLGQAPGSRDRAEALTLELETLAVPTAKLETRADGVAVIFAGGPTLHYADLAAFDASGRRLPSWLEVVGSAIRLRVDDRDARYPLRIDPLVWSEQQQLIADGDVPDAGPPEQHMGELFGWSVAVRGTVAIVGAPAAQQVIPDYGSAYLFERTAQDWQQQPQRLVALDQEQDGFGRGASLDGNTVLIGASYNFEMGFPLQQTPTLGAAYLFVRNGVPFEQQAKLVEEPEPADLDHRYGWAVSLSGDIAVVGAPRAEVSNVHTGAAYVYLRSGTSWALEQQLSSDNPDAGDAFGYSVSLSGERVAVGAPGVEIAPLGAAVGAVYVFQRSGTVWTQEAQLEAADGMAGDKLGASVALRGDQLIAGANTADGGNPDAGWDSGSAYVFARTAGAWEQKAKLIGDDLVHNSEFGRGPWRSRATARSWAPPRRASAPDVLARSTSSPTVGGSWEQVPGKHLCSACIEGCAFGHSLTLEGTVLLVGAPLDDPYDYGSGSVFVLTYDKYGNGDPCAGADTCASGFCVDDVCCESDCGDAGVDDCLACSVDAGSTADGFARPRSNGSACDDQQFCTTHDTCSNGTCTPGGTSPCPGPDHDDDCQESCNPDAGTCDGYDGDDQPCGDAGACRSGQCLWAGGASCSGPAECQSGNCVLAVCCAQPDCGAYRCGSSGVCLDSCSSANQCAPGYQCTSQRQCVPVGSCASESGCSCTTPGGTRARSPWWAWAALLLGVLRAHRRCRRVALPVLVAGGLLSWAASRGWAQSSGPAPAAPSAQPSSTSTPAASTSPSGSASASASASAPSSASGPAAAAEDPKLDEARRLFRQGNELRRAGDCQGALELYRRSRAVLPSVPNTWNTAVCLDALGRYDQALDTYDQLLTEFRDRLTAADRAEIRTTLDELRGRVGSLDLMSNVEGSLVVDGRMRGKLPLTGPVSVLPGKHLVQVMKDGYGAFESEVDVRVGQVAKVVARLEVLAIAGRLAVDEPSLPGAEVYVDGAAVGAVPWEGTLEPGEHVLVVLGLERGSAPQLVSVVKGQVVRPRIVAGVLGPELQLSVRPASAEIFIGHAPVGRGQWRGRLPVGEHRVEAREEGYFSAARAVVVSSDQASGAELVLQIDAEHPRWGTHDAGQGFVEAFGAVALAPSLASGAEGDCAARGCQRNPWAIGFLAGARGGYEFPVGVSIMAAAGYLSLSKGMSRQFDDSFVEGSTTVATSYALNDALRLHGPFVGAGVGYRLPFAEVVELRGNVLLGALFAFSRDELSGLASADGRTVPIEVDGSGKSKSSADLFVMPELQLGLRFGGFGVSAGLAAMVLALKGPSLDTGDVSVLGDGCVGEPTAIDCAPGEAFVAGERAYGTAVVLLPSLTAGYAF